MNGALAMIMGERGNIVAVDVGEAVLDEVLCGFEAVIELGVGVPSLHCFREEACDVFTVSGEAVYVLLELCWDAHWR